MHSYRYHDCIIFLKCNPIPLSEDCKISAVGGYLKPLCQDNSRRTIKCANSNTIYDVIKTSTEGDLFSNICENDPKFYQACSSSTTGYKLSSKNLLCGQFVCQSRNLNKSMICNVNEDQVCSNTRIKDICTNERKICDGICDAGDCKDESICQGLTYGKYCKYDFYHHILGISLFNYMNRQYYGCKIWGQYEDNLYTARTSFLYSYTGPTCQHSITGVTVPIFNYTRCAALEYNPSVVADPEFWWVNSTKIAYCTDMMDQTNCTDPERVAISCMVNGYPTNVSKYAICHGRQEVTICDNGIENNCLNLSPSCYVHKHKICDKKQDCADNSDELHSNCLQMTDANCTRVLGGTHLPLPLSWLGDGTTDCISMEDEQPIWPTCGFGQSKRFVRNNKSCSDDLLCFNSEVKFVPLQQLCDLIDTCGNENEICKQSRGSSDLSVKMVYGQNVNNKYFPQCMKGLEHLQGLGMLCTAKRFRHSQTNTFGIENTKTIIMPSQTFNCDNVFGEVYLLSSCSGYCMASECPLKRPVRYDSCSGQYPNRIYTVANMEYLTFVTSKGDTYQNDYFVCKNTRCVDYKRVCDLVDDCGDGSDEEECTNQLQCNSSGIRIPKWFKCDGKINCQDLSDECNDDCGKQIIQGLPLKMSSWIIGVLAVTLNGFTTFKSLKSIKYANTSIGLLNKMFITMISLGDFLVGGYLLFISIMDLLYGSMYCFKQTEWLSSKYCSALGVLSTLGSQLSLFAMTFLSSTRLFGVKNAMRIRYGISIKSYTKVVILALFIVLLSVSIAILPLLPQFEDFFVNGMNYENNPMFVGFPDKNIHLQVAQAYYGRMKSDQSSISWVTTLALVDGMFSKTYGGLKRRKIDFYGNDGVCLFKFFVTDNDPQRVFTWTVLGVNCFCFIIISMSYLFINFSSMKSRKSVKNNNSGQNYRMQRKISIIIATDFCCWVPFVMISCLHSASILDATPWYALFSVVILPINSVINPLLYDNVITHRLERIKTYVSTRTAVLTRNSANTFSKPGNDSHHKESIKKDLPLYSLTSKVADCKARIEIHRLTTV